VTSPAPSDRGLRCGIARGGTIHVDDGIVRVRKICVGPLENNAYVVACARTGEAVVVDAAAEPDGLIAACEDLDVKAVLTTHGHADHVGAAAAVCGTLDVPFRIHRADAHAAGISPFSAIAPGEAIDVGALRIEAIHTPGHTRGSLCFAVRDLVFTGDTMFPGGPGATAGPTEFAAVMTSLRSRLFTLPDDTLVLPGHGLDTTIGAERPSLPEWERRGY
jgi:glyoxylase-like metal-dependent hydrolase (beta-lactamase superfamily II)